MASASDLKKGSCFLHRGNVVKVNKKELVAYGTHSHSKLKFFVEDLFNKKQDTVTLAHQDNVETVDIIKKTGQVISKNPLQIMDIVSYETLDAEADEELINSLNEGDEVIFVSYRGKVSILEKK